MRLICQTLVNPALKPLCDMLPKDYSQGDNSCLALTVNLFQNLSFKKATRSAKTLPILKVATLMKVMVLLMSIKWIQIPS